MAVGRKTRRTRRGNTNSVSEGMSERQAARRRGGRGFSLGSAEERWEGIRRNLCRNANVGLCGAHAPADRLALPALTRKGPLRQSLGLDETAALPLLARVAHKALVVVVVSARAFVGLLPAATGDDFACDPFCVPFTCAPPLSLSCSTLLSISLAFAISRRRMENALTPPFFHLGEFPFFVSRGCKHYNSPPAAPIECLSRTRPQLAAWIVLRTFVEL